MTTKTLTRDMTLKQLIVDTLSKQSEPLTSRQLFGKLRQRRRGDHFHAVRARLSELRNTGVIVADKGADGTFVYAAPQRPTTTTN